MKKIFSKEFIIGLSVIIAALVLFFGIEFLKGINLFRPANYYYAYYSNVDGLAVASPVQVNGYKVGQVREIIYDYADPGKIKVMLAMDKKLSIPADSYAEMGQTMLSGAYINLKIGKSAKKLAVGEEIPSGASSGLMESLSNEVMPAISQIMPKIDSLLSNLNTLVADPALLQSIQRLDGITANEDKCRQHVHNSIGVVTALNPVIGYKNSTKIAKEALETGRSVYDLVLEHDILSKEDLDTILSPENMIKPVKLDIKPKH